MTAVAAAGWTTPADGDGGLIIPNIGGDDTVKCGVSPSDPEARDSCNHSGGNGTDGKPGAVHHHDGGHGDGDADPSTTDR